MSRLYYTQLRCWELIIFYFLQIWGISGALDLSGFDPESVTLLYFNRYPQKCHQPIWREPGERGNLAQQTQRAQRQAKKHQSGIWAFAKSQSPGIWCHQWYDTVLLMFIWYQFYFLKNRWESNDYLVSQYMVLLLRAEKIEPGCSIYKLTLKA